VQKTTIVVASPADEAEKHSIHFEVTTTAGSAVDVLAMCSTLRPTHYRGQLTDKNTLRSQLSKIGGLFARHEVKVSLDSEPGCIVVLGEGFVLILRPDAVKDDTQQEFRAMELRLREMELRLREMELRNRAPDRRGVVAIVMQRLAIGENATTLSQPTRVACAPEFGTPLELGSQQPGPWYGRPFNHVQADDIGIKLTPDGGVVMPAGKYLISCRVSSLCGKFTSRLQSTKRGVLIEGSSGFAQASASLITSLIIGVVSVDGNEELFVEQFAQGVTRGQCTVGSMNKIETCMTMQITQL
jgi:hypothetical protein